MLDEPQLEQEQAESTSAQLDRIASAIERLPGRVASALRSEGIGLPKRPRMRQVFIRAEKEHREAQEAKRRANIAIGLTAVTALGSLIAATGTLIQG